ncbi:MAG TPA: type II toxin-antitoxin system Phd/YefM family antitoxin [Thermoanaerobaculia bacterium]|nr:type II toxin-antitoxin system Phd/YefM family antitoxin [Thermoanaerobaculia bacterium]
MTNMTMTRNAKVWTLADAKAHLSEVVESALKQGPQLITRHGRKAVVVISADEWERKSQREGTLADFFAASPLRDSGLAVERPHGGPRDVSGPAA